MQKHTQKSVRLACADLESNPDGIATIGDVTVRRMTRATGCSLGNVRVIVEKKGDIQCTVGRFNEIISSIVALANQ